MPRILALLLITLLIAGGSALAGCSSSNSVPDDEIPGQPREYSSVAVDENGEASEGGEARQASTGNLEATGPVATVNGETIDAETFNLRAGQLNLAGAPPELLAHLSQQIVEDLVNQKLIADAVAEEDLEITDAMIEERTAGFRLEFQELYGEDFDFDSFIAQQGFTEEEVEETIAETIAIEALLEARGMEEPTEEDARAYYDANPGEFDMPERVAARHILITVQADESAPQWEEAREEIEALRAEIEGGADFATLAREHSQDGSAQQGGALGEFVRGQMVPEFEEVAFQLEVGEVSEPVRTQFGWHLIEVTEKMDSGVVEFEEIAAPLQRQLKEVALQEALDALLIELRQNADIEIHNENIQT